ncbi:MAG: dienelactone hydrolase family protein [Hyphomicrobiaceae bacterium]
MRKLVTLGMAIIAVMAPALAQTPAQRPHPEHVVPLPQKLEIEAPKADVPSEIARFHGAWAGTWGDEMRHILIIERVEPSGLTAVVYATGDFAPANVWAAWERFGGTIKDGTLTLTRSISTVTYAFDSADRLIATHVFRSGLMTAGLLQRIDAKSLTSPHILQDVPLAGERVFIPHDKVKHRDGSGPIRLEARVYRPTGTGPAPLAVINHGSDNGRGQLNSYGHLGEARWLLGHGFAVLVPMRRGRGQSEGVSGEGTYSHAHSGQIIAVGRGVDEGIEDLEAAIAWGRAQPFVKPGPVLLAGQSRGGFLSVVYAGRKPEAVLGVVNFVGGWMGGGPSNERFNTPFFAEAGRQTGTKVPQLWLYAERDSFYGEAHIRANHKAFTDAGGVAQLEFYKGLPMDGHLLRIFPARWREAGDAYVKGLPR